ncbi:MAG: ABC transporter permease [Burkholderiaceae bacterium]|jgi:ABC-2 type transport system permease protein|nr:ABC transporter permease [Burkholderiaceae bacterium]
MLAAIRRIAALVRKELLAILSDGPTRIVLVAPAIMQTLVFGYAATFDLSRVPYAVLDASRSQASAELLARVDSAGLFQRVANLDAVPQIAPLVEQGQVLMVLHIPQRLEAGLAAGESVPLQLILDARNSTTAGTAAAYLGEIVAGFNAAQRTRAGLGSPPLRIETRAWFNPQLETRWNFVPALIAALSMLQTLMLTALSVAREREQGTFDQLLVTPLSPAEIMVGKALPPVLIGLLQATLVLSVALWWFGIPLAGSPLTLYVGLVSFMLAGVGIGLAISALAATMQQAMFSAFVLLMPMMLLSGLATPVANMPAWLQLATWLNPLRFGIDYVRRVYLEGVGLATLWPDLVPMLAMAAITLPLAAWLFRNRLV